VFVPPHNNIWLNAATRHSVYFFAARADARSWIVNDHFRNYRRVFSNPLRLVTAPTQAGIPICPSCGKIMVLRASRRGTNAGKQFWGCSAYPTCKGMLNFSPQGT